MKDSTFILIINLHIVFVFCSQISCTTNPKQSERLYGPQPGMPYEEGKCFAKCLIQDQYTITTDSIAVYSNIDRVEFDIDSIRISDPTTKWVKKKADINCNSEDPGACLVWCLIEGPAQYKKIKIPVDPSSAGTLSYETVETKTLIEKGGYTEWREVVCSDKITAELVQSIENILAIKGYKIGKFGEYGLLGKVTKSALTKYQKDKDLPIGQLDFETLKALGIDYEN